MAKVTVILTSYNHAKYLREAIDSVLSQSFSDFELIIGDDASTDDSWDIIQSYSDPRIRAFRHETNKRGGVINELVLSGTINSDYIAIQHSDDIWEPQKLEKQVSFLESNPTIGAVFTNVFMIDENGNPLYDESQPYQTVFDQPNRSRYEWLNYFFYVGNALCHPSVMIRKKCYEDCGVYRYGLTQLGDFDLWIRLCFKYEIYVLSEKLFRLRIRSDNLNASANRPNSIARREFEFWEILNNYRTIATFEELLKIFPLAHEYENSIGYDVEYVLGRIALGADTFYNEAIHLFGLSLLFEGLNDDRRAQRIAQLYGFTQKEFAELSAENDVFSARLKIDFKELLAEKDKELVQKEGQISLLSLEKEQLNYALSDIYNSRAWKLITKLRTIQKKIALKRKIN